MKYLLILLTVALLAAGCSKAIPPAENTTNQQSTNTDQSNQTATENVTATTNTTQKAQSTATPPKTSPTPQTPPPKPQDTGSGEKKYTTSEVAAANSESNCLSIINGSVYNLTTYMSRHPGGKKQILSICGKDGTSAFSSQHGGNSKVNSMLSGFKVGVLTK